MPCSGAYNTPVIGLKNGGQGGEKSAGPLQIKDFLKSGEYE
jgi:hypothetical protein